MVYLDICERDEEPMKSRQELAKVVVKEEIEKAMGVILIKLYQRGFTREEVVALILDEVLGEDRSR